MLFLDKPYRSGLVFLLQSIFYFLPSIFLFSKSDKKFSLQLLLTVSYSITGLVFFVSAAVCFVFPKYALSIDSGFIFGVIPGVSFCIFLMSGFIMMMISKERSDMQVLEIQNDV